MKLLEAALILVVSSLYLLDLEYLPYNKNYRDGIRVTPLQMCCTVKVRQVARLLECMWNKLLKDF